MVSDRRRSEWSVQQTAQQCCQLSVKANQPHADALAVSHLTLRFTWRCDRLGYLHVNSHTGVSIGISSFIRRYILYLSVAHSSKCYCCVFTANKIRNIHINVTIMRVLTSLLSLKCNKYRIFSRNSRTFLKKKILYLNLGCVIYARKRFYVNKSG